VISAVVGKENAQTKANYNMKGGQKHSTNFVPTTTLKCFIWSLEHTIYQRWQTF